MTQYIVDGEIGRMQASGEDPPAGLWPTISTAHRLDAEQTISLTSPTQLDFAGITWKIRFPDRFFRPLRHGTNYDEQQYDDFIDGRTGYARDGSWFVFQRQDTDEWFEVHGGVDNAWWQFLFQGYGKALFTDGTFSESIDITEDSWYYVSMQLSTNGFVSVQLTDSGGNLLAMNFQSVEGITIGRSFLGATGTVFDVQEASEPVTPYYCGDHCKRSPGQTWGRNGSSGYDEGYWVDSSGDERANPWDVMTHQLGTCAGITATAWTTRPYWASCEGMLDYVFYNNRTVATWFKLTVDEIPAGYSHLEWRARVAPDNAQGDLYGPHPPCDWLGAGIIGYGNVHYPTTWGDGYGSGSHTFAEDGWQLTPAMLTPVEYIGTTFYLGVEPAIFAAMPPWYKCGGGFDWPWRVGGGNSWRGWVATPDDGWEFRWVNFPVSGGDLAFECDEIILDADINPITGDIITEDTQVMEGWNTEMLPVENGQFTIEATPVRGSVNVYTWDGKLLDYGKDWEEADDLGLTYDLLTKVEGDAVTVIYFVTRPVLGNEPAISRPTQEIGYQETPRKTRTPFPM